MSCYLCGAFMCFGGGRKYSKYFRGQLLVLTKLGSGSTLCKYRTWLRVENLTFQHLKVILLLLKIGSLENRNRVKELDTEQLLVPCCEVQAIHLNTWGYRALTCFRRFLPPFRPPFMHSICLFVFPLNWKERIFPC